MHDTVCSFPKQSGALVYHSYLSSSSSTMLIAFCVVRLVEFCFLAYHGPCSAFAVPYAFYVTIGLQAQLHTSAGRIKSGSTLLIPFMQTLLVGR